MIQGQPSPIQGADRMTKFTAIDSSLLRLEERMTHVEIFIDELLNQDSPKEETANKLSQKRFVDVYDGIEYRVNSINDRICSAMDRLRELLI